jgi:anti-sigma regulatory factor (Ser/Thr protein kinase)
VCREQRFLACAESIGQARDFVTDALVGTEVDRDDAALLTSEVATNAVRHADTAFRLRIESHQDAVRIEVINDAPELLLMMHQPSVDGGRGLRILDDLAQSWGVETSSEEKVVWFELARS